MICSKWAHFEQIICFQKMYLEAKKSVEGVTQIRYSSRISKGNKRSTRLRALSPLKLILNQILPDRPKSKQVIQIWATKPKFLSEDWSPLFRPLRPISWPLRSRIWPFRSRLWPLRYVGQLFLVADTRLCTLPCWSVGRSVRRSVGHISKFRAVFALLLLPNRPWLDSCVSGLVSLNCSQF